MPCSTVNTICSSWVSPLRSATSSVLVPGPEPEGDTSARAAKCPGSTIPNVTSAMVNTPQRTRPGVSLRPPAGVPTPTNSPGMRLSPAGPLGVVSLVTGGRGVLGRAVVDALRSAGPRVRMLDVREPALRDGLVELVTGGVTDPKTTREAVD